MAEHAVLVRVTGGHIDLDAIFALEDALIDVLEETPVGEMDGHDVSVNQDDATFYLYGPDADALFATIVGTLRCTALTERAMVTLRYGEASDESAVERRFRLGDPH